MDKPIRASSSVRMRARELRHDMTEVEKLLWQRLRKRQLGGFKFRRQSPLCGFIVDFYCAEKKLVIELDGNIHDLQIKYDGMRTDILENDGYTILRFKNDAVLNDIEGVLRTILSVCTFRSTHNDE